MREPIPLIIPLSLRLLDVILPRYTYLAIWIVKFAGHSTFFRAGKKYSTMENSRVRECHKRTSRYSSANTNLKRSIYLHPNRPSTLCFVRKIAVMRWKYKLFSRFALKNLWNFTSYFTATYFQQVFKGIINYN